PVGPDQPSDWPDIMAHAPAPEVAVDLDALAALNYTGGTTGLPKGCEHTQRHMVYTALTALLGQGSTPGEGRRCTLGFLPMFWIAGQNLALLCPLVDGSEVVILTRWNASAALELVESRRVTFMSSPVENYLELLEHPDFSPRAVESLTTCTSLSFVRKLDIPMRECWREATGVTLRTGPFGMTESHTSDTFTFGLDRDDQDLKAEPVYCGYPVPGTSIVIVDDELEPVPQGETGQI